MSYRCAFVTTLISKWVFPIGKVAIFLNIPAYKGDVSCCVSFSPVCKVHDFGTPGDRLDINDCP
eukprot:m.249742 g.249742  ORF g.249742 m.249742 type:complete len:64 (-) comp26688_c1_seq5:96-287(-)